ncbi:oligosaccharide flippase family protein [Weissella cibaria]|nr:oligosaccharide flippase family protein [Weissella cibaria]
MRRNMQKRIGALLAYLNVFVQNGVYLLYTPLLLSFLGKSQYGLFQLTSQTVNALTILMMGFAGAYVRFYWVAKNKTQRDVNLLNGVYITFFGFISIVAVFAGYVMANNTHLLYSDSFSKNETLIAYKLMIIMALNVAVGFLSSVFNSFIIANEKFIFQQIRVLLSILLQPIIVFCLLHFGYGVVAISLVQLTINIGLLLLSARYAIGTLEMKFEFGRDQYALLKGIITFSGFILINQIVDLVNNNFPGMIVGKYLTASDVAIYAVVIQIRALFFQLSLALSNIFVPQVNQLVLNQDDKSLTKLMVSVGRIQLTILLLALGGFVVLGESFIKFWAGQGFEIAYWMIIVMVIPVLIPLSQNIGLEIQRAKNLHKIRSVSLGALAVFNVIITVLCVQKYGVFGSVIGYVISILIGNGLIMNIYNHFFVGIDMNVYWKRVSPVLITPLIPIGVGLLLRLLLNIDNVVMFMVVGFIYMITFLIIWFKCVADNQEKKAIKTIVFKMMLKIKKIA